MSYQVKETLPYWYSRYIKRNKDAKLAPLFLGENDGFAPSPPLSPYVEEEKKRDLEGK